MDPVLIAVRVGLFVGCKRYFLSALYQNLQSIAVTTVQSSSLGDLSPSASSNDIALNEFSSSASTSSLTHRDRTHSSSSLSSLPSPNIASGVSKKNGGDQFHAVVAHYCFSLCFSESCMLFLLVVCQAMDLFNPMTRAANWKFSLFLLLGMILLVIPFLQNFLLAYRRSPGSKTRNHSSKLFTLIRRALLIGIPFTLYIILLLRIPLPQSLSPSASASLSIPSAALARLTLIGTIILGLLSGFGAVSNAWDYLPSFCSSPKTETTSEDVIAAEHALFRVRNDLAERRKQASIMPIQESSWLTSITATLRGTNERSALEHEITGLTALEYQMSQSLQGLKESRQRAEFSKTLYGKLVNSLGNAFAIYCIVRIVSSIVNITDPFRRFRSQDRSQWSYPDLIAAALALLVSLLPSVPLSPENIATYSRQISLGLVGMIILSSIRVILRGVSKMLRLTSKNLGASLLLLMLAQLMGVYLLSTLVQLRVAFPPPSPSATEPGSDLVDPNLFHSLPEYQLFGSLFDWTFLTSAVLTIAVRWIERRISSGYYH